MNKNDFSIVAGVLRATRPPLGTAERNAWDTIVEEANERFRATHETFKGQIFRDACGYMKDGAGHVQKG